MLNGNQRTIEPFAEDLSNAFQDVRGAFTNLLASVQADARYPQEVSRRFGVNKNLAWQLSKVVTATDPYSAISNLPGLGGVEILCNALEAGGASPAMVEATRSAIGRFEEMVTAHMGDRATLRLALASMAPDKMPPESVQATRKLAYQGNSCTWGIQCRVRLASFFIAPNPHDSESVDTVSMGGFIDVRRLRSNASVPLFMRFAYNDDGTVRSGPQSQPIDPDCDEDDALMLWKKFCSTPIPEFSQISNGSHVRYHLAPGQVGNTGLNTWVYGEFTRRFASIYRDDVNDVGEHAVPMHLPIESLLCDLMVHRDLVFAMEPRAILYSLLGAGPDPSGETSDDRLPLTEQVQHIGSRPPVASTLLVPCYAEMVQRVYERMEWSAEDFHGYRIEMKYPPMSACMVLQHDLADRQSRE